MKSKINYKQFCQTQITPFKLTELESDLYDSFGNYIEGKESGLDKNKGVFIRGVVGSGKTIMFKMAQRFSFNFRSIMMLNVDRVIGNIEAGEKYDKYLYNEWCFDDLGTEQKANQYGKGVEVFKRIIEERYDSWKFNGLITHFTSNLSNEEIMERYGERAYDRLKEMCNVIKYPNDISKRGLSEVKPFKQPYESDEPKEISENDKAAILRDSILEMIKEYDKALTGSLGMKLDTYGVYYNHLVHLELINPNTEEKKKVFEIAKGRIMCDKITDKNDRNKYQDFKNGNCDRQNKYYVKCQLKAKSIMSKQFFNESLKKSRNLNSEINKNLSQ